MVNSQRAVTDRHRQKMADLLPLILLLNTLLAAGDRACDVGEECAPQDQCPDFLRQKADQLDLRRGSSSYTRSVESLLARRCGRGRVCCPCPTHRCQSVPSCPTVKGLYADFVGEDKVSASLAALRIRSLVCDKTKKAICCPSEADINKFAKARKMRKLWVKLFLQKFGLGKVWVEKVEANFFIDFLAELGHSRNMIFLNWAILRR